MLRAFEKLPTLREPSRFRPWFYSVLLSVHRSRSRAGFWRRFLSLESELTSGNEPAGEDGAARAEEHAGAERAFRALATLPAEQREAVVLFELDGYTIEEIAAMQRVSASAVKSRLVRGRGRLRRFYARMGFGDERVDSKPARRAASRSEGDRGVRARAARMVSGRMALAPVAVESTGKEARHE